MIKGIRQNPPWLTIALAGSAAALYAALGPAPEAWVYDRAAIADGEWWRLFSGHWLHGDGGHLGWNLVALLLLSGLVESRGRWLLLACLLLGSLVVDAVLGLAMPDLAYYCGLSGVLNALLLPALAGLWRHEDSLRMWPYRPLFLWERVRVRGIRQAPEMAVAWRIDALTPSPSTHKGNRDPGGRGMKGGMSLHSLDSHGNGLLWLVGALSLGKVLVEMVSGSALFTHTAWASVPESHLAGWMAGLLLLPWCRPSGAQNMLPSVADGATFPVALSTGKKAA